MTRFRNFGHFRSLRAIFAMAGFASRLGAGGRAIHRERFLKLMRGFRKLLGFCIGTIAAAAFFLAKRAARCLCYHVPSAHFMIRFGQFLWHPTAAAPNAMIGLQARLLTSSRGNITGQVRITRARRIALIAPVFRTLSRVVHTSIIVIHLVYRKACITRNIRPLRAVAHIVNGTNGCGNRIVLNAFYRGGDD